MTDAFDDFWDQEHGTEKEEVTVDEYESNLDEEDIIEALA